MHHLLLGPSQQKILHITVKHVFSTWADTSHALQAVYEFHFVDRSPDRGVHAAVIELFVVQLSKERKQDLDASYRVDGTVDGVGNDGLHILWEGNGLLMLTETHNVLYTQRHR